MKNAYSKAGIHKNIRKYLATIVSDANKENWYTPNLFIENTLPKLPRELEVLENPPNKDKNYNCFIYALRLSKDQKIIQETKGFIYSGFFQNLIDKHELVLISNPQADDIILYRNLEKSGVEITHVGIVQDDGTIVSKWSWGPVLKHGIFDVPDFYGNEVRYVTAVTSERARELFQKYKIFNRDIDPGHFS